MEVKYHLHEHIDHAIAAGLRLRGVDVTTTVEQGLDGASDTDQLAFARAQGRVLVTCDSDFIALSKNGASHAGIVFWTARRRRMGQVVLDLVHLRRVVAAEEMVDHVEFL